jgi:hypothetical protein
VGGNAVGEDGGVALEVTSEYGDKSEMKEMESKRRAPHDRGRQPRWRKKLTWWRTRGDRSA